MRVIKVFTRWKIPVADASGKKNQVTQHNAVDTFPYRVADAVQSLPASSLGLPSGVPGLPPSSLLKLLLLLRLLLQRLLLLLSRMRRRRRSLVASQDRG